MERIGLIDVDGHNFPNIPLMKIATHFKKRGCLVEWYSPFEKYSKVFKSKVFFFTPDYENYICNAEQVIEGGTGYAYSKKYAEETNEFKMEYDRGYDSNLPDVIEREYPDYSIYGIKDTAFGFLTRGCPRNCSFCIVGKKEGLCSRRVADLDQFWEGQKNIVLCDPNILACKSANNLLQQLVDSKANIDFNQGLDARLLTDNKIELLQRCKIKSIHFAWDNYNDGPVILPKLKMFAEATKQNPHGHNAIVYVLVNYNSTIEEDLERIYTLRDIGFWAYVMVYDKAHAKRIYKDMQRWCNNRFVFAKTPLFSEYRKHIYNNNQPTLF